MRQYGLPVNARRSRALRVARMVSRTVRAMAVGLSILPTFCLLYVPGTYRTPADTLARNADKIDTFRGPPMSADVRDKSSHGENRGSSPLGSANNLNEVRERRSKLLK